MALIGTDIDHAASLLSQGKLVAIPTDTVYGLAGNALDIKSLNQIYEVKNRPITKALIAQISSLEKARPFLQDIPEAAKHLANQFWPGALTLVLDSNNSVPAIMTAGGNTLGIRVPNHHMTLQLLQSLSFPLAVPSANISTQPSPTTAMAVNKQIGDQIDYILDGGDCAIGFESTIIGFRAEKPVILRAGAISEEEIMKVLNTDKKIF